MARRPTLALALVLSVIGGMADRSARADDVDQTIDRPIIALEGRIGYGMAFGGGAGVSVERWSPVTFSALVDHAVVTDPWTSVFVGVAVEGHGRGAAGAIAGLRVRPTSSQLRLAGGGALMVFPATAFGPLASVGTCIAMATALDVCGDLEATVFVVGSDIPDERIAGQIQLVIGVGFDAW
ncbi:MAG TPA: hypothetical protein VK698_34275 [Kofleriaceae bacterium]|nr:hypothetical protein [Kofleriaceae bacterium]